MTTDGRRATRRSPGRRAAARRGAAAAAFAFAVLWPAAAAAYPWMIRHGYGGCATCHVDPSGGELLTAYGRVQSDLLLRTPWTPEERAGEAEPARTAGFLWGAVQPPEALDLGGSFRQATVVHPRERTVASFPMQADLWAHGRLGRARAEASLGFARRGARAAQVTRGGAGDPNLISRTHWVGWDWPGGEVTVRAGRLNLPYGVRIVEHTMWVRAATRTDRESAQQHGAAVSYEGAAIRGEAMAIAGNYQVSPDMFRERGYSAFVEALPIDALAVGASSLVTRAERDRIDLRTDAVRQAHGVFVRAAAARPLAVLAEVDVLLRHGDEAGHASFVQIDVEPVRGVHAMSAAESLRDGTTSGRTRLGTWWSAVWYVLPHVDVRVDAIFREATTPVVMGQVHAFL